MFIRRLHEEEFIRKTFLNETSYKNKYENTKFQTSDDLDFEAGILKAGTYALFATPNADHWILEFYSDTTNWGMPEKWDEQKVALRLKAAIEKPRMTVENLTIGIEKME